MDLDGLLVETEARVNSGRSCGRAFWQAVEVVKRDPRLVDRYADRIGALDRAAFENAVMLHMPLGLGTTLALVALLAGIGSVVAAFSVPSPWAGVFLLAGTAIVLVAVHGLAHLVVGAAMGMRFTHWFSASWRHPHPGVKVDYASYLRTPARRRAWMHASGAIVGKLIPFLAVIPALMIPVEPWVVWTLVAVGVFQLLTDAFISTKSSDWMKFRREMAFAHS